MDYHQTERAVSLGGLPSVTRVVLLTTNLARGGAEVQVTQLAGQLRRHGWNVSVISLLPFGELAHELAALGVPVFSLRMRPGRPDPRAGARLAALLNKIQPQIVHAHMVHANLLARCIRLICPVPVLLCTVHSMAESGRESPTVGRRDWLYRMTDWLSDLTVCVSKEVAGRHVTAKAIPAHRLRVILNSVDTHRFRPNEEQRARMRERLGCGDAFVWLAVGRLMWKKDYPAMLEALAKQPDGVLLIAGEGPLQEALQVRAIELGIDVRLLGQREDIAELMNACDGLLLSSIVEGLPLVLLEAAASGLPCVATEVGGVGEVVVHGRTGYVVPPRNPAALASAMLQLTGLGAEARREMSRAAREHALARFDSDAVWPQWEGLYAEMLASARTLKTWT